MTQIPKTHKKFREAETWFQRLVEAAGEESFRLDSEKFEFSLSAFLSAARSVTFVLQKEQKKKYDAWSWGDSLSQEDRDLCKFMIEQRNLVQKTGDANVKERTLPRPNSKSRPENCPKKETG